MDLLRVNNVSGDEVLAEAQSIYPRWPKMSTEEKRPIVQALIEKVTVGKGEVELSFSYLPTSEEVCKSQQQLRGPDRCVVRKTVPNRCSSRRKEALIFSTNPSRRS